MSKSTELTNQIIDFVYRQGGYAWRASSVGVYDSKMQSFRASAKKGVSDILACLNGQLIAIEVKIGTDRLSDEQKGFLSNVKHAGGISLVATTLEQFIEEWSIAIKNNYSSTGTP